MEYVLCSVFVSGDNSIGEAVSLKYGTKTEHKSFVWKQMLSILLKNFDAGKHIFCLLETRVSFM